MTGSGSQVRKFALSGGWISRRGCWAERTQGQVHHSGHLNPDPDFSHHDPVVFIVLPEIPLALPSNYVQNLPFLARSTTTTLSTSVSHLRYCRSLLPGLYFSPGFPTSALYAAAKVTPLMLISDLIVPLLKAQQ